MLSCQCDVGAHATLMLCNSKQLLIRMLTMQGKIKSLEQIYLFSMPVKEYQIVEAFLGTALKDEVMKIMPVQKQTRAGQRTRFKVSTSASATCYMVHFNVLNWWAQC